MVVDNSAVILVNDGDVVVVCVTATGFNWILSVDDHDATTAPLYWPIMYA